MSIRTEIKTARLATPLAAPLTAVLAVFVASAGSAEATTVIRLSNHDMTERAEVILHGKVVAKSCRALGKGVIVTDYRLAVSRVYKDGFFRPRAMLFGGGPATEGFRIAGPSKPAQAKTYAFTTYGGVIGDRGSAIHGAATYQLKEEIFVFLSAVNKIGCRMAIGLAQGKYTIRKVEGKTLAFRDLEGLKLLDPKTRKIRAAKAEQGLPLATLVSHVTTRVGQLIALAKRTKKTKTTGATKTEKSKTGSKSTPKDN